jgi:NAD(P)-dependent dehydrogenase (short-subunit alcohol dehydrogenase family)
VGKALEDLGAIDILVNNAGYGLFGAVEEVSDEQIEHLFQTNFFGSLRVARAFMPYFRAQGKGQILQISNNDQPARNFKRFHQNIQVQKDLNTIIGDPQKMAKTIIQRVDEGNGPLRLVLGSDAYEEIKAALTSRLAELEAQKETVYSTNSKRCGSAGFV